MLLFDFFFPLLVDHSPSNFSVFKFRNMLTFLVSQYKRY